MGQPRASASLKCAAQGECFGSFQFPRLPSCRRMRQGIGLLEFDVDAMATCPDQFPRLAVKRAQSPEIARLFEDLARRAEVFAKMLDEFTESVGRHRSAREGRPVRLSRRQQQMLSEFDRDAEKAVQEMERHIARLDDATLLSSAL